MIELQLLRLLVEFPTIVRVYHFLTAEHALDDIRKKRIKISEIEKLNDPFELWCSAQGDREIRAALRRWKKEMARKFGILCFCQQWHNPVLWSHYADSHRGICLGFDVAHGLLAPVNYVAERTPLRFPPDEESFRPLLFTKYRDWSYEEEFRGWFALDERDATGHFFYDFDDKVQLKEVIGGPLCEESATTIHAAMQGYDDSIQIIKSRLAFNTFQIVQDLRGFRS